MMTTNHSEMTTAADKDATAKAYDPHDSASVFEAMFGVPMPECPDRVPEPERSTPESLAERLAEIEAESRDCVFRPTQPPQPRTGATTMRQIRTAMSGNQIEKLNAEFDRNIKAGLTPFDAMEDVASNNHLTQIAFADDAALYSDANGDFVNCWFDDVSAFGFDDQIEVYEI